MGVWAASCYFGKLPPNLVSMPSRGPEGLAGKPGLAGFPEPCEGSWHIWRRELSPPWSCCSTLQACLMDRAQDWPFKHWPWMLYPAGLPDD